METTIAEVQIENNQVSLMAAHGIPNEAVMEVISDVKLMQVKKIRSIVCKYYGISDEWLNKETRKREVVLARQICMKKNREVLKLTWYSAAMPFGKDHATAMHGSKTIDNLLCTDKQLKIDYAMLSDIIEKNLNDKCLSLDGKIVPYISIRMDESMCIHGSINLQLFTIRLEDGIDVQAFKFEHSELFITALK